ncbi:hypothetical protein M9435_001074 [Picochlorum sp. BPE23]|nr:hypothetical protein M9435_001074 [Picochlorum sp. BPE23]
MVSYGCEDASWCDKYRLSLGGCGSEEGGLTVFDFSEIENVPEEDWIHAQHSERQEISERDDHLIKAERAGYEKGHEVHRRMPVIRLQSGYDMPKIGLGTWKAERGEVRNAVHSALKCGYRHIDCASVYQNEDEVGDAIHYVTSRMLVDRKDLFICSKVWNTDHSAKRVREACMASLRALKVDYLDLYLIHWPVTGNVGDTVQPPIRETWEAMESLVRDGLVRSIGVSNFSSKKLQDILSYCTVKPSVCQVEVHPYHRNDELLSWCRDHGIHVTAFSPLGSPDSESIFPRKVPAVLMQDPRVKRVAERTGKNVGQVLIRWALQHGTSVIPKSTNPSRISGNLDVLDWELPPWEYNLLSGMAFQMRMVNGGMWLNPKGPYRTMQDLWDEEESKEEDVLAGFSSEDLYFPSTDTKSDFQVVNVPCAKLSSGYEIPLVGIGTWKAEKGEVRDAVYSALKCGYRHIDCASVYQNEDEVGDAIHYVTSRMLVDRKDLFICSKVWNTDHSAKRVREACMASLRALKVDYLDLYLIHWPVTGNVGDTVQPSIRETWEAMESLVRDGLVRSIGVSNFSSKKLQDILSYCTVKPSVCQVEVHPYHRNDELLSWCRDHGIHVTAFSPLGSPDSESIFPRKVPAVLMQDPRVKRVAERTGKNVGQVLIRWALQHGTSVIPKSTNPSRISGNLDVLDWELPPWEYNLLSGMAFQMRMVNGGMWLNPKGPYRTMQDLWDEEDAHIMTEEEYQYDLENALQERNISHPIPLESSESSESSMQDSDDDYQSAKESAPNSATSSPMPSKSQSVGRDRNWGAKLGKWFSKK